jgi:hypothetical protein
VKPAAFASLAVIALSAGCVHFRLRDGPGHVDLARPPPAIEARGATLPRPTTDRALVLMPGVLGGVGVRQSDNGAIREAGLGVELSIYATHVHLSDTALGNKGRDYGFDHGPQAWGINLGWTPSATRSPAQVNHQPSAYVEAQWWHGLDPREPVLLGVAAGVAFTPDDPRRARTAVQIAPMLGPLYGRFQVLLDGNIGFELGVAVKIPVILSWAP